MKTEFPNAFINSCELLFEISRRKGRPSEKQPFKKTLDVYGRKYEHPIVFIGIGQQRS